MRGRPKIPKYPELRDREWLKAKIMSFTPKDRIAREVGCSTKSVDYAIEKFDLPKIPESDMPHKPHKRSRKVPVRSRSENEISHFRRRQRCYMVKAKNLMNCELVDPSCDGD